jgi:hypothetical protein
VYRLHELLRAYACHHGQMLNTSAVARTLGTTPFQVSRQMRQLRAAGFLRLLPALPHPSPHDIIRKPRVYLRPRGWRHAFVKAEFPSGCMRVPIQGELAARTTDSVIERETARRRRHPSTFHSMGRYRRRGVDLVVARHSGRRIGFCFEPRGTDRSSAHAARALREALRSRWIHTAILVTCEGTPCVRGSNVLSLPAPVLLAFYSRWTSEDILSENVQDLLRWINDQYEILTGGFSDPRRPMALDFQYDALDDDEWLPAFLRPP